MLSKRYSMKTIFTVLQSISMVGAVIYCFAAWPLNSAWYVVLSRLLVGTQGGSFSLLMIVLVMTKGVNSSVNTAGR